MNERDANEVAEYEAPRSWAPLIIAGVVAAVLLVVAMGWWFVGADVDGDEAVAIEACEQLHAEADLPEIVRGGVDGPDGDGVYKVAWDFADGTRGGCDVAVQAGVAGEPELAGDIAPSPSPSPSA